MSAPVETARGATPLTSYQKKLFAFLSVATFFEGYDFFALTQLLDTLGKSMHLDERQLGSLVAFINIGTVLAFVLVRLADRWGRKLVLTITIAGYTLFTFATGLAPNVWVFAICQFVARTFLIGEWAISMVYAAEEFPADRRGMVIGVIQAFSSLGAIVCAGVVPMLVKTSYGWRSVYFVGILPLVILAFARRGLRETARFAEQVGERGERKSLWHIWRTGHRGRMLQLALVWALTYVCTHNAITFWNIFAVRERGLTQEQAGNAIALAAVVSMPLVFLAGKLLDRLGRKLGAVLIFGVGIVSVVGCYSVSGFWALSAFLILGIFGTSAILPVLNAFTTELFPTELRGDAFAWSNNLLGRVGYVISPELVGIGAAVMGWGAAVRLTAIGPLVALVLILVLLPETKDRPLEETSRL